MASPPSTSPTTVAAAGSPGAEPPARAARGGRAFAVTAAPVGLAIAIALWGVLLAVGGAVDAAAAWAPAAIGAGLACIGAAVIAWLGRRPAIALAAAVAATSLGAITAGWLAQSVAAAGLGIGGLLLLGTAGLVILGLAPAMGVAAGRRTGAAAGAGAAAAGAVPPGPLSLSPEIAEILRRIDEHAMLSDNARRVLFRERELALLEAAIEEDIRDGRFDVALTLVGELGDVFGERDRAEQYRQRMLHDQRQRHEAVRRTMLLEFDGHLDRRQWRLAQEVADRLRRGEADPELAVEIDRRFFAARARHKADLEAAFLASVERGQTEDAMRLLRELDHYLAPEEAERFREIAGGVIKQHRENLGVQFKLAVNDHRWAESVRVGETIMAEFPNTKMAIEVRSMIELLRSRAAGESSGAVVDATGSPLELEEQS